MMLKLLLFIAMALIAICQCQVKQRDILPGGIQQQEVVSDEAKEIANWTIPKISELYGYNGVYTVQEITKLQTQVVAGVNYFLTIVYSLDGKPNVSVNL